MVFVVGGCGGGGVSTGLPRMIGCWAVLDFRPVFPIHDIRKWPQNGFLA